jgi:hypothetical protein
VEKGSARMVQNVRIPEGSVKILIESDCNHHSKLMSAAALPLVETKVNKLMGE